MKIEFENTSRRLSFLFLSTRHQKCLDKSLIRGNCLKGGGTWIVSRFKGGGLGKKEGGGVFEGRGV